MLLLPTPADSLAGRMEVLRLHPLAQGGLARLAPDFLQRLFSGTFKLRRTTRLGPELAARIVAGGYPAGSQRTTERRRSTWYRDYVTLLERVFLGDELAPWHGNRLSRLIKTPKVHVGDTGLAAALLGINARDWSG